MAFWGRKKIKVVYFDVGGVLINCDLERYIPICCAIFRTTPEALMREMNLRVPSLECGNINSRTFWRQIGESLWRNGEGTLADDVEFHALWRNIMESTLSINEDVVRLCYYMSKSGIRVGILSNAIAEHADLLRERGIYKPFTPCLISCEVGIRKPDEQIFRIAAEKAQVKPGECLFIDDVENNVIAAENVGMQGYVYTDAQSLAEELLRRELLKAQ